MNKDQMTGSVKSAAGKAQRAMGEMMGSKEQQAKGLAREAEGKMQKKMGDVKETLKDQGKKTHH